jgi:hypothetical protein
MPLARGLLDILTMRLIALLFAGVLGTGCYASTTGYVAGPTVGVTATTVAPDLVYVSPGVQVIADYDEPVFYSGGYYWRETGGVWYRSSYHTHGWIYAAPPSAVVSIGNRHSYRHYRPAGWRSSREAYRPNNNRAYRQNYNPRPSHNPAYRPAPAQRDYKPRASQPATYNPRASKERRHEERKRR